jgi:protease I
MAQSLEGQRIAVLATNGFEQAELTEPVKALRGSGARVDVVSLEPGEIQGMKHKEKGDKVGVDRVVGDTEPGDYAALVLPGGVANPDELRMDLNAVRFVRHFVEAGKPIAAICHGPWTLIEADAVRGKRMTSWPSLRTDLKNAGADWVDQEVVADRGLVTSRKPDDLPAFCAKMIEAFAQARRLAA